MIVSEYVRGLRNNYVRIRELSLPDERKYQYCIMKRGGISGFLPFEIRYIDSDAYMYYDITSRQNISTLYSKKPLDRKWIKAFFSSMKMIRNEAVRFLLTPDNLIWNPSNVYQDIKTGKFGYLYVPYLDEDNGMSEMMEFLVSHVDYSDEELVRCVYSIAEQYKSNGEVYLQEKIYLDADELNVTGDDDENASIDETEGESASDGEEASGSGISADRSAERRDMDDVYSHAEKIGNGFGIPGSGPVRLKPYKLLSAREKPREEGSVSVKKSLLGMLRAKDRKLRNEYSFGSEAEMTGAVADETKYSDQEETGEAEGTVFVDLSSSDNVRRIESESGSLLYELKNESCVIGKNEDADLLLDDVGISRMHARIYLKDNEYYLEDLNSTNGTYKNGLKLKPYEQKKLSKGDEIRLASRKLVFR